MNSGGQVFPFVCDEDKKEHLSVEWGMDVRTLLAGMAMQGILSSLPENAEFSPSITAATAVKHADALIAALNKEVA